MKTPILHLFLAGLFFPGAGWTLHAQLVADGATTTLANVTNTITGSVTVGTNGAFTLLVLSDNALLSNSAHGVIGRNATALSNEVQLISATARWRMGGDLYVGSNGAANRLVVSNGAVVENNNGSLAARAGSSNNVVLVTGVGSLWSNRLNLAVGWFAPGNRLLISNGGRVFSGVGSIGSQPGGSNNLVLVSGSGSHWTNQFNVGVGEPGNRLVIEEGGRVSGGTDGAVEGAEALVTGPGSLWSSGGDMAVGLNGSDSRLVVSNGAAVVAGGNGRVGIVTGAARNEVLVTGAGSLWSNQFDLYVGEGGRSNRMEVNSGGRVSSSNTFIGLGGGGNLAMVAGAGSLWSNRADLYVGQRTGTNQLVVNDGATVFAGRLATLGVVTNANGNSATVTGPGSTWIVASNLVVGATGSVNRLTISNAALALTRRTILGLDFRSTNNLLLVTGPGSRWTNSLELYLGFEGSGNRLIVSDGAAARTSHAALGKRSFSSSNAVAVSGPGSVFDVGLFVVGEVGGRNRLTVEDGALVSSSTTVVGQNTGARFNELLVRGPGSVWRNDLLLMGVGSEGNRLTITNGGEVIGGFFNLSANEQGIFMGGNSNSVNNRIVISSGALRATNAPGSAVLDLMRGTNVLNAGLVEADLLRMTNPLGRFEFNGGTLVTRGALISNTGVFTVGTTGGVPAIWDVRAGPGNHHVANTLFVGLDASFAQLIHTNGAFLTNSEFAHLGVNEVSRSNSATLAGPASRWSLRRGVVIGDFGSANRLTVSDGASLVTADRSFLGIGPNSSNNEVVVSGPNSSWTGGPNGLVQVGSAGKDNRLIVAAAGQASHGVGILGVSPSASNNLALITGPGSLWNIRDELRVGGSAQANQLVVSNGAAVFTGGLVILGADPNASRNSARVTGSGSSWLINSNLCVGSNGALCQLTIANGALVGSEYGTLGVGATSSNNVALITGPGSVWSIVESLQVGRNGGGNQLLVTDGARLIADSSVMGLSGSSSGNAAFVQGPGTLWTNADDMVVGISGSGNRLTVADGARVESRFGNIGSAASGRGNEVVVSGTGSVWRVEQLLNVGSFGSTSRLVVTNGGRVIATGVIGAVGTSSNNEVVVTGPGSSWTASSTLFLGAAGGGNRLVVRDGGEVIQNSIGLTLGAGTTSLNNRLLVAGGSLRLVKTNLGSGILDLRRGTNVLDAGLIEAAQLLLTNALGFFEFNGGTLAVGDLTIGNNQSLRVGNGVSPATLRFKGDGQHAFGSSGVTVSSNGVLTGSGTAAGALAVDAGGLLSPGNGIGRLAFTRIVPPKLRGTTLMEISRTNGVLINDVLQTAVTVAYGGSLIVSNVGPGALVAGDRFRLFVATGYFGAFTNVVLPPLDPGLDWENSLTGDGSIGVIVASQPGFAGLLLTGTNLVFSGTNGTPGASYAVLTATNVTLPLSNWVSLVTNQFSASGQFTFTNGIAPTDPQRYFRLRTP